MNAQQPAVLSLVLPVFGEGDHLATSVAAIQQVLDSVGETYEVILVDDGSPDDTWEVIGRLALADARVRGLRLSRNFGKDAAVCAGVEEAQGEALIVMDADLQHPPSLIPEMVRVWRSGQADVVEATKQPASRESVVVRWRRRLFGAAMRRLAGLDLDGSSDFKLFTRPVRQAWLKMGERNLFFRGMLAWLGFRRVKLPFEVEARAAGKSRWSTGQLAFLAVKSLTAFSTVPVRLASVLGLAFFVFAVVFGAYAVVLKLSGVAMTGFTTVILLQLIIGSAVLLSLGIIGEYVGRIYEEVKHRPRFIVADVTRPAGKTEALA